MTEWVHTHTIRVWFGLRFWKIVDWDVKNQIKQIFHFLLVGLLLLHFLAIFTFFFWNIRCSTLCIYLTRPCNHVNRKLTCSEIREQFYIIIKACSGSHTSCHFSKQRVLSVIIDHLQFFNVLITLYDTILILCKTFVKIDARKPNIVHELSSQP